MQESIEHPLLTSQEAPPLIQRAPEFQLRAAQDADLVSILKINLEILDRNYRSYRTAEFVAHRIQKTQSELAQLDITKLSPKDQRLIQHTIVATHEDEVVGYITIYPYPEVGIQLEMQMGGSEDGVKKMRGSMQSGPGVDLIEWLYIRPSYQGCGLSRKLLECVDTGRVYYVLDVHVDNVLSQRIYQHFGFVLSPVDGDRIIMGKLPSDPNFISASLSTVIDHFKRIYAIPTLDPSDDDS